MPDAAIGHGSDFLRSDDATSGGTFATIGNVISLTPPNAVRETPAATTLQSTERWREYIGGMKEAGEATAELDLDPNDASLATLYSDLNTNTAGYYKITFPDSTAWGFAGLISSIAPGEIGEERMTVSVTFKLTGKPGWIS